MKLSRIALFSALVAVAASASAQIVQNGSFESFTGAFGGDNGAQLLGSSTTLTGWTIVGGEIAILKNSNAYNLTASDGVNFLDLAALPDSHHWCLARTMEPTGRSSLCPAPPTRSVWRGAVPSIDRIHLGPIESMNLRAESLPRLPEGRVP